MMMSLKIESKALSESMLANFSPKKNGDSDSADFGALLKHAETRQSDAAQELEKYLKMSPAERMAAAMMKKLGITKEQFDAMPPEQQAAVTAKITAMIKQEMEQKTAQGQDASSSSLL
jgi:predicted flavoprotein YhiN